MFLGAIFENSEEKLSAVGYRHSARQFCATGGRGREGDSSVVIGTWSIHQSQIIPEHARFEQNSNIFETAASPING
jgi:hypothetical protein